MKKQLQQLRRFFSHTRKYQATATRAAVTPAHSDDDDEGSNRLSAAFIIVLLLHFVAIVGVFAYARIRDGRKSVAAPDSSTQTTATKSVPKPAAAKPAAAIAAATPAPTATPTPARESLKTPQTGVRTHIVVAGENLTRIALAYSVGIPDLQSANKLKGTEIKVGQSLTIPDPKQPQKTQSVVDSKPATSSPKSAASGDKKTAKSYVVQKGDTPIKIAREIGCTYEELVKLNNIKDPKKIKPGQVLKVPVKNG